MTNLNFLERDIKLRRLFTELIKGKGYAEAIFYSDFFDFFRINQTFSSREIKTFWRRRIKEIQRADSCIYLYIHIPFCRQKCNYCNLDNWIYGGEAQMDDYVHTIITEMRSFRDIFADVKLNGLELRGGTANILTEKQLRKLFAGIDRNFVFDEQAERTFECNPYESSGAKLKIASDFGINRISFGVQSVNAGILRGANRGYQNYDVIKKIINDIRKFPQLERISADLLIGLHNDTPQTVFESFLRLAELNIDLICVHPVGPTPDYLKKYYNNQKGSFERQLSDKLLGFEKLVGPMAKKLNYGFIPLNNLTPDQDSWDFELKKYLLSDEKKPSHKTHNVPFDVLGVGMGSWSMITNTIFYRTKRSLPRDCGPRGGGYVGINLCDKWGKVFHMLRMLGLAMKNRISISQYKNKFGTDIFEDFREPLEKLQTIGAITVTNDVISLTAKTVEERFAHMLFFVDNETILAKLNGSIPAA